MFIFRSFSDYLFPERGGGIDDPELEQEINQILGEMNKFVMNELWVKEAQWF